MPANSPRVIAYPLLHGERGGLAAALTRSKLPVGDLDGPGRLFWRFHSQDDIPLGFGGLEIHGEDALMRSIVTLPPVRGRGIGRAIVATIEREAALANCQSIWVLTRSADSFFERLGYARCDRNIVPDAIRASDEYAALSPTSAAVMRKRLA